MKNFIIFAVMLCSFAALADTTQFLVGGTITNKKTKARLGIACSEKDKVNTGEIEIEVCSKYEVVLLNGKNEPDYIRDLTVNYSSTPDRLRSVPEREFGGKYSTDIYDDWGIYGNIEQPYFYGMTAANAYTCSQSWGWCLLLPFTIVADTVATIGGNAGALAYDGVVLSIAGIDQIIGGANRSAFKKKMLKDIIFMLNSNKKGKNRTISNKRFELFVRSL